MKQDKQLFILISALCFYTTGAIIFGQTRDGGHYSVSADTLHSSIALVSSTHYRAEGAVIGGLSTGNSGSAFNNSGGFATKLAQLSRIWIILPNVILSSSAQQLNFAAYNDDGSITSLSGEEWLIGYGPLAGITTNGILLTDDTQEDQPAQLGISAGGLTSHTNFMVYRRSPQWSWTNILCGAEGDFQSWSLNWVEGTFDTSLQFCNTSPNYMGAPFRLMVQYSTNSSLAFPDGTDKATGLPYLDLTPFIQDQLQNNLLPPGQCVTAANIHFFSRNRMEPTNVNYEIWAHWLIDGAAPSAISQTLTTRTNAPLPGTLRAYDPNGQQLTYGILSEPQHGSMILTDQQFVYSPAKDFSGSDRFTFYAINSEGAADTASVTIKINLMRTALPWISILLFDTEL